MKRGSWILKGVIMGTLFVAAVGFLTQQLWNWLIPVLFAGPMITFWQAVGLLVLTKILFWSFGSHSYRGGYRGGWKPYWKEKWNQMTPEEREKFRQKMKDKCSWGTSSESSPKSDQPS